MFATPLPFVFPYAVAFWAAYVWAFYVSEWEVIRTSKTTAPTAPGPKQDSLRWMMSLTLLAQVVAFAAAFWLPARFSGGASTPIFFVGIALLVAGSMLRRHCFHMLGESFTIDVRAIEGQSVVDRGAYAIIRHPGYTAGIVMLVAVGLCLGSFISLAVLAAVAIYVYLRRIEFEERALEAILGEKYRVYAAKRKRLLPYVY